MFGSISSHLSILLHQSPFCCFVELSFVYCMVKIPIIFGAKTGFEPMR